MKSFFTLVFLFFLLLFATCKEEGTQPDDPLPPVIDVFYPEEGSVGCMVTVSGFNFSAGTDDILITVDGKTTNPFVASNEELSFRIPEGVTTGTHPISIQVGEASVTSSQDFKVLSPAPAITDTDILGFNYIIGTQTFAPLYRFTEKDELIETAEAILDMGSNILKISLNPEKYNLEDGNESAVSLVRDHPSFKKVLDMPFYHYFFWVGTHSKWRDGYSEAERQADSTLIGDLAMHLLTEYDQTGKRFFLGHWEGDWYLLPGYDKEHVPTDLSLEGMIQYYNARQNALEEAKRRVPQSDVEIFQYAEVNRVVDAMDGKKRLTNYVLPYSNVDYVSYSSYDAQMKNENEFHQVLDYLEDHLPEKPEIEGKRVFIGEYGRPAAAFDFSKFEHNRVNRDIFTKALNWGVPYVLFWEMYNNEARNGQHTGFWMIDDKGVKWPIYYTHRHLLRDAKSWVSEQKSSLHRLPTQAAYLEWLRGQLNE